MFKFHKYDNIEQLKVMKSGIVVRQKGYDIQHSMSVTDFIDWLLDKFKK